MAPYQGKRHDGRPSYGDRKSGKYGGKKATATERKKYVAPTANHHDVLFTSGTTKDAAEFKDTVQILARHVSTASGWKQGLTLAKVMTDLAAPVYAKPARPERRYYLNTDTTQSTKDWMLEGTLNVPIKDNFGWSIETDQYKRKIAKHEAQVDLWADNNAKGYSLVLQHCPDDLETELRNQEAWSKIDAARSVVDLLILIQDLQYNKTDCKSKVRRSQRRWLI